MNSAVAGCTHTPATANDAAVVDGGAETASVDDAGVADGGGEVGDDAGASYVRVACTRVDPAPGPLLDDVECGRLTLTARTGSGRAVLPVLRLTPHTVDKKADPVIVLAGGPGQSAIPLLRELFVERPFLTLLSQRDVIAIGFRGTDGAEPNLACAEAAGMDFSNRQVGAGAADSVYGACRTRLDLAAGPLTQFGSRQNAEDVIAFVQAAGIPEWNAYAFSYGTRAGVELARMNPQGLRAIVLDSAVPAATPLIGEGVLRGNEVLARVLADCKKTPSCEAAFPNLSEKLERLLDRFAATPEPRRLPDGVVVTIDDSQILFLLQSLLSFRAGAEQVPLVIDALDADVSQVDELLQALVAANRAVSDGLYLSVACREVLRGEVDQARLTDPFLGRLAKASHTVEAFGRLCSVWGLQYGDGAQTSSSNIPTLILTGELDPGIRPEWGALVAASLGAAQTFTLPGEAHVPGDTLCGSRVVATFMESPQQPVSEACVTEPRPLRFAIP
jgi:pimeloyl-ACP methyl ester carboxylesterase